MERKIVKKWFWVWEFEKEEQWLNTMAQSGWVLDKLGLCKYEFVSCEAGEYTVRLEMRDHDQEYIDFMAETGAEYVGRMAKWIYFRKKAADGPFDIFSDIDSRIAHLDKIGKMLGIVGGANMGIGLMNILTPGNLGWINLCGAALLYYALGRIHGKKEALVKDRLLRE